MTHQHNKTLALRSWEELVNRRNVDFVDELFHPEYVMHMPDGSPAPDADGTKVFLRALFVAFPDMRVDVHDVIAEGDRVMTRETWRGTHVGEWMGAPPTGQPWARTSIHVFRFQDGRVIEEWTEGQPWRPGA
ncbi:MAG: ester cyclase [Anaerolineae bacterium]|nr:ester cyclase [Anaerolineae bacterium]